MFNDKNMKIFKVLLVLSFSIIAVGGVRAIVIPPGTCITLATTSRGMFLTTKAVNEPGPGTIDATSCDIGDYITTSMTVTSLTVHDAEKYGIFVDSGGMVPGAITVTISGATVYNIGNHVGTSFMPDGSQRGIGIIYDSGTSPAPLAKGAITSSNVYAYQKGGIVVNHNSNVNTTDTSVTGLGPVDFIAQNGIQYSRDAQGIIRGNTVSNNFYTGTAGLLADGSSCGTSTTPPCPPGRRYFSTGILLFDIDPSNIQRGQNDLSGNQRNFAVITDALLD